MRTTKLTPKDITKLQNLNFLGLDQHNFSWANLPIPNDYMNLMPIYTYPEKSQQSKYTNQNHRVETLSNMLPIIPRQMRAERMQVQYGKQPNLAMTLPPLPSFLNRGPVPSKRNFMLNFGRIEI